MTPALNIADRGRLAWWQMAPRVRLRVVVYATKRAYGRERMLVAPLHGEGEMWVDARTVALDSTEDSDGHAKPSRRRAR